MILQPRYDDEDDDDILPELYENRCKQILIAADCTLHELRRLKIGL